MAAQFPNNQHFDRIVINAAEGVVPRTVYAAYTTFQGHRRYLNIDVRGGRLPADQQQRDDLAALQVMHARDSGIVNAVNGPADIIIEDTISGAISSIDDLEMHGAFNPLVAGYQDRYRNKLLEDGKMVAGGKASMRFAGWGGYRDIPDTLELSIVSNVGLGYSASKEHVQLARANYHSGQIRIVNDSVDPADCLLQAKLSWGPYSPYGWFMGIGTTFQGFAVYPWEAYRGGVVIRLSFDGIINLLHCGHTDGNEGSETGIDGYLVPATAGSWTILASGVRALTESDSASARRRNGAIVLEPARWSSTTQLPANHPEHSRLGMKLETFGPFVDIIQDGDHLARWRWADGKNPFREGANPAPGNHYIIRGNGGNIFTWDGAQRTPDVRCYAYNLSAARSLAPAPANFS